MKKVCIISSSPRRNGNSDLLCQQFLKGAIKKGHQVDLIHLDQYQIHPCHVCEYCRHHQGQCYQKDDSDQIIQKMIDADVWVLASPVYFYSISAQMKLLIDRFFAREYEIREGEPKKAYLILTSGSPDLSDHRGAIESLRGFIQVLRRVEEAGFIDGSGAFKRNDVLVHPAYLMAYEIGMNIEN